MQNQFTAENCPTMEVFGNTFMFFRHVAPGGKVSSEGFCKVSEYVQPEFSSLSEDYGINAFAGQYARKNGNGEDFFLCGDNHHRRYKKSAEVVHLISPTGKYGLPLSKNFITAKRHNDVMLQVKRLTEQEFGFEGFNYGRPSIRVCGSKYGVGNLKELGYAQTYLPMFLPEGAYYKVGDDGMSLILVDPHVFSRPSLASTIVPCKRGNDTYNIGGAAGRWAKEKGYKDAIISCYDINTHKFIPLDCSAANIAVVLWKNGKIVIVHPVLKGRALFGITMQALIHRLKKLGIEIIFRDISDDDFRNALFCITSGTAAGINVVSRIGWWHGEVVDYQNLEHFKLIKEAFQSLITEGVTYIPGLKTF